MLVLMAMALMLTPMVFLFVCERAARCIQKKQPCHSGWVRADPLRG